MGKSAAQIRRNEARAAARGDTYVPPQEPPKQDGNETEAQEVIQAKVAAAHKLEQALNELEANPENLNSKDRRTVKRKAEAIAAEEAGCTADELVQWYATYKKSSKGKSKKNKASEKQLSEEDQSKLKHAKELKDKIAKLEADEAMNAKERRSAKRKAEAIATEESGCPANELLEWYDTISPPNKEDKDAKKIPYIVFIGQLSYSTTTDMIYDHFHNTLGPDVITKESVKIRLLTDSKTKKSRGMAFVELDSPEAMYECLRMHLTHLDGRRINGERAAR